MQKKILYICTLLTIPVVAMEEDSKIPLKLTHQSPEITRVHSQDYLKWLEKQADIDIIHSMSRSPYSYATYQNNLNDVASILTATNDIIEKKNNPYSISMTSQSYSMEGNTTYSWADGFYAAIPIAAAHALATNICKHILIIDEELTQDPDCIIAREKKQFDKISHKNACKDIQYNNKLYYKHGNGALLYPNQTKKPDLFNLFNNKVITYDKIYPQNLWAFLNNEGKNIDLVFYNINADDPEYTERKPNIFSLLQKHIPTVFIFSENQNPYKLNPNDDIISYIHTIADQMNNNICFKENPFIYTKKSTSNYNNETISISSESSSKEDNFYNSDLSSDSSSIISDDFDLDPLIFKITTHKNETKTYDGANQRILAKDITITEDGVMEVILDNNYDVYSNYKRYDDSASTSSNNDDDNGNSSNESSSTDTTHNYNLTHQSPEITCIHTEEYLTWLTNNHSEQVLTAGLTWVAQALNATDNVINAQKNNSAKFNHSICVIPDSFYAAGNSINPRFGDLYAIIPIAAAHALKSNLFEKILIIEEHINNSSNPVDTAYNWDENGSIFNPHQKNQLCNLFDNKILIQKDDRVWASYFDSSRGYHAINPDNINIDLAFYNIDEDAQDLAQRTLTITTLLKKNIPIVFICTSQSIADDIQDIIEKHTKYSDKKEY